MNVGSSCSYENMIARLYDVHKTLPPESFDCVRLEDVCRNKRNVQKKKARNALATKVMRCFQLSFRFDESLLHFANEADKPKKVFSWGEERGVILRTAQLILEQNIKNRQFFKLPRGGVNVGELELYLLENKCSGCLESKSRNFVKLSILKDMGPKYTMREGGT